MKRFHTIAVMQRMSSDEWIHINATTRGKDWEIAAIQAGNEALAKEKIPSATSFNDFALRDWNYWMLAVVELTKGLPIAYNGSETYMPDVDAAAAISSGENLYVAAGEYDGDTWVQKLRAQNITDVQIAVRTALDAGAALEPEAPWSILGTVIQLADGSIVTWTGPGVPAVAVLPAQDVAGALQAINRHRARVGQQPLDPARAGWSPQDILDEAQRIARTPNPPKLKRRLLR